MDAVDEHAISPGRPPVLHWRSLSDGLFLTLVVTGPTLFLSLVLRDQRQHLWKDLLVLAAAGVLAGAAMAGRHRRLPKGAIYQGLCVSLLATTTILAAEYVRDLVLSRDIPTKTLALWGEIEVASLLIAAVGGLIGRAMYLRSKRKQSKN